MVPNSVVPMAKPPVANAMKTRSVRCARVTGVSWPHEPWPFQLSGTNAADQYLRQTTCRERALQAVDIAACVVHELYNQAFSSVASASLNVRLGRMMAVTLSASFQ